MEYTIKSGDNLSTLAKRFGTTVEALAQANGIKNVNLIYAGKTLNVPESKPQQAARPPASPGLLSPNPAMFDPKADAIEGSYPDLMMAGVPGLLKVAAGAKGLLGAAPAVMKQNPARYMPAVMKKNPKRLFNELSARVAANEPKFTIGGSQLPEAVALEDYIAAQRFAGF
jgi:LysM repeat protein